MMTEQEEMLAELMMKLVTKIKSKLPQGNINQLELELAKEASKIKVKKWVPCHGVGKVLKQCCGLEKSKRSRRA